MQRPNYFSEVTSFDSFCRTICRTSRCSCMAFIPCTKVRRPWWRMNRCVYTQWIRHVCGFPFHDGNEEHFKGPFELVHSNQKYKHHHVYFLSPIKRREEKCCKLQMCLRSHLKKYLVNNSKNQNKLENCKQICAYRKKLNNLTIYLIQGIILSIDKKGTWITEYTLPSLE